MFRILESPQKAGDSNPVKAEIISKFLLHLAS